MEIKHSLTAYKCEFSYMARNNPIDTAEMKEAIKNGEKPNYSLSEFISDYIYIEPSLPIKENAERVIKLTQVASEKTLHNGVKRTHIQPMAGKQNESLTLFHRPTNTTERTKDKDALYDYNVVFYDNSEDIIAIFYRKGTSGCKSVFLETANEILRNKGIKLDMALIMPLNQRYDAEGGIASQVTLKWRVPVSESSDIVDDLDNKSKKQKTRVVQSMAINLKAEESGPIKNIVENLRRNIIDEKTAFAQIATKYLGDDNRNNFNDAAIDFKVGNRIVSRIQFGEIENLIGAYNITGTLNTSDFVNSLLINTDAFYKQISEGAL